MGGRVYLVDLVRSFRSIDAARLSWGLVVVVVVIVHPFENETTQQIAAHPSKKEERCGLREE